MTSQTHLPRLPPYFIVLACLIAFILPATYSHADETEQPLRFGVLSLASPAKTFIQWQDFADYLANELGREVKIVAPKGFKKIKKQIEDDKIDVFYVNSLIYYKLKNNGKALPIAQMQNLLGKTVSNSVLFARNDTEVNSIQDLKGEKIAFISPMGAGGYLAPRAKLRSEGIGKNIEEVFTKNLTSSIHKVLLGDVKAGTMCGLNFNLMTEKLKVGDLKIISTSDDYPENVIAARKTLPETLRNLLSRIIINMDNTPKGRAILDNMKNMKINKFVKYNKANEAITQRLLTQGNF